MLTRDFDAELAALSELTQHAQLRPYQVEGNAAIEQAITAGKRKLLATMATGTALPLAWVSFPLASAATPALRINCVRPGAEQAAQQA